jgi:Na+-driven multidrug efflux pump
LVSAFALSGGTLGLCVTAIRVITLGYLFAGANITFQGVFQALGNGMRSLIVSLLRLIIVALPAAFLFTTLPNAKDTVWWAFPIAECCTFVVALIFMKDIAKKKFSALKTS